MRDIKRGGTIDWLIQFVGDRCTVTRAEALKAAQVHDFIQTRTIKMYFTTHKHYGHVLEDTPGLGRPDLRWGKRIAYFSRIRRGVYTLTPVGWRKWAELTGGKPAPLLEAALRNVEITSEPYEGLPCTASIATILEMPDLSGTMTRSQHDAAMASVASILKTGARNRRALHLGRPIIWETEEVDEDPIIVLTDGLAKPAPRRGRLLTFIHDLLDGIIARNSNEEK